MLSIHIKSVQRRVLNYVKEIYRYIAAILVLIVYGVCNAVRYIIYKVYLRYI